MLRQDNVWTEWELDVHCNRVVLDSYKNGEKYDSSVGYVDHDKNIYEESAFETLPIGDGREIPAYKKVNFKFNSYNTGWCLQGHEGDVYTTVVKKFEEEKENGRQDS